MGWENYNSQQHFEFYKLAQDVYRGKMFYDNGEPELFAAPKKDFVSVLEVVCNLKDPLEKPKLQGQLKLHVQFDRETEVKKTFQFENEVYKSILDIAHGTKQETGNRFFDKNALGDAAKLKADSVDIDVRYCRRERHELGPLSVQDPKSTEPKKIDIDLYKIGD